MSNGVSTKVFRSVLSCGVIVSTVRVGREYLTAFGLGGRFSDPIVTAKKADASFVHDFACDFANYPNQHDAGNRYTRECASMLADVAAV